MTTTTKMTTTKPKVVKAKTTAIPKLPNIPFCYEVLDAASKQRTKAKKIEDAAIIHSEELQEIFTEEVGELETAGKERDEREKSLKELEMELLAEEMKKAFKKEG